MTDLEKAWREGYDLGYDRGSDDACAFEWGVSRGPKTQARNKEDEWDGSETKAAISSGGGGAERQGEKTPTTEKECNDQALPPRT